MKKRPCFFKFGFADGAVDGFDVKDRFSMTPGQAVRCSMSMTGSLLVGASSSLNAGG